MAEFNSKNILLVGLKGNVMFATFEVDTNTGNLIMNTDEDYSGANFSINRAGELEVTI